MSVTAATVPAGTAVQLTATVKSGGLAVSPGQVRFCRADYASCPGLGELGTVALGPAGTATRRYMLPVGNYSIYAEFLGTATQATSTSAPESVTVQGNSTYATKAILSNVTGVTGKYSLGASLVSHGPASPTGSLTLTDATDVKTLGTVKLPAAGLGGYQPFGLISTGSKSGPNDLMVADLDGDGIPDVAVPDSATGVVAVFLGKGDGTFAPAVTYSTGGIGSKPLAIAAGDLNGDGNLDLVVALGSRAAVAVLLGVGDGTFQPMQLVNTAGSALYYPLALALADLNGDGRLDLVTANNSSGVSVLLGTGGGGFGNYRAIATDSTPTWIAAGDLNNDGVPDLVVPVAGDMVDILLGNGDGSFQKATQVDLGTSTTPESVALTDLDGDGNLDVLVACYGANALGVLLGNGDGSFAPVELYGAGSGPISVSVGDLNGDGLPDAIVTDLSGNGISLFDGNGDGTLMPMPGYTTTSHSEPAATAAVDLDASGTPELISVLYGSSALYILESGRIQGALLRGVALSQTGTINLVASYAGDNEYASSTSTPYQFTASKTIAVAPAFSPVAGSYTTAQTVTLTSATSKASIYYTLDGTTPTTASKLYSTPISVPGTETISAIAVASGLSNSSVATAHYQIAVPAIAPSFSPQPGSYTGTQKVTIQSSTPKATIYYTVNGSTPTEKSAVYAGPLTLSSSVTLMAIASATGYLDSPASVGAYTITQPTLALASSVKAPVAGQSLVLTATLTAPKATNVAATWTILDGQTKICTTVKPSGTSTACAAKLASGKHSLTAKYVGTTNGWTLTAALALTVK